ncbi:MAG: YidB family protein [Bacillota bacterium]
MENIDRTAASVGGNQQPFAPDARTRLIQATLALLADNGQNGGLHGLREHFQEAGLGNVLSSWIGTEENVPITPIQIQEALGDGHLQQIAEEAGLSEDETARQLSELLPEMVDALTPAGYIPRGGLGTMSELLERFLRGY